MGPREVLPEAAATDASDSEVKPPMDLRRGLHRRHPIHLALTGMALVLLGAGGIVIHAYFTVEPTVRPVEGNFPVNSGADDPRDISSHNSPTVVANPVDEANLAIANRIDTPLFSCALHVSFDGGTSWAQTPLPVPPGEQPKCYAPDAAFGSDGTLFVSFVTLKGRGNVPNAAWIVRSDDGGETLSDPVQALGPLSFQVRLAADPDIEDRLYLTWLAAHEVALYSFPGTGNPVNFSYSYDGGATWSDATRVSAEARERVVAPSLAVGGDGNLYVSYIDLLGDRLDWEGAHAGRGGPPFPGTWQLVVARSHDSGVTWSESVVEDELAPVERFIVFLPSFPSIATDGSGRVYVSFHDARTGDPDVYLWRSEDGGESFSEAVRVNDTVPRDGTSQYLPKVDVASNERVDIIYYDRRNDPENVMNEVSLQSSLDYGETFSDSIRISDRSFDSRVGFGSERDLPDLGSRLGLLSTDTHALGVWTDTRAGTEASSKQDLTRALIAISNPPRLPDGVDEDALSYAGWGVAALGVVFLLVWVIGTRPPIAQGRGRAGGWGLRRRPTRRG